MTPDSHIPAHAASIWAEGEELCLSISGHTFRLPKAGSVLQSHVGKPFDVASKTLATLAHILRQREAAPTESIGFESNPHQTMTGDLLRAVGDKWLAKKAALRAEAKDAEQAAAKAAFEELFADLSL